MLFLAIAGVVPSTGTLRLGGQDLHEVPTHRGAIGLVFQDGQLFTHFPFAGYARFGLEDQRLPRAEQEHRVEELLDLVGLPGAQDRHVTELSGGERRRVALARTLAPKPQVVLLDEPLSSLDASLRSRLAVDVCQVLMIASASWIVVTHDHVEAEAIADPMVTINAGVVSGRR